MSTYRRVEEYLAYAEHEATVRAHQAETSEVRAVHRCSAYCNQDLLTLVNSCKARIWYPRDSTYLSTCTAADISWYIFQKYFDTALF